MNTSLASVVDSIRGKASGSRTQIGNVLAVALLMVVVAGTFMVFTKGNSEKEILRIAIKQGVEGVALKQIARHFNDKGRADAGHIQVEVVEFPYDQLYELEQEQLDGRDYPPEKRFDVIMVDDPWLYSLVLDPNDKKKRRLDNLNGVLKDEGDYFPRTLSVCRYCPDGQKECPKDYYAVPFVANSQLFAHRGTDLLVSDPPTWKQILDASEGVERTGRLGYIMRIGPGNSIVTDFMPILWAYDPKSFPEYPKGDVLNQPDDAFKTLVNLVGRRKSLGSAGMDDFDVSAYLQVSARQGGASMGIVWSAWAMMLANLEDDMAKEAGLENGSHFAEPGRTAEGIGSPLPTPRTRAEKTDERKLIQSPVSWKDKLQFGKVPRTTEADGPPELGAWLLAVPFNADHKDDAKAFIRFATEFASVELAKHKPPIRSDAWRANPTPRKSVLAELAKERPFTTHPSLEAAIEWSLENARFRPRTACWKEIESRLGKNLEKLLAQNLAPAEAVLQMAILQIRNDIRELIDAESCRLFLQEQAGRKKNKLNSEVRQ